MIDLVGGNIPEGKNFHITRRTGFSNRKFSIPLSWIIPREDKGEPCKKKKKKKKTRGKIRSTRQKVRNYGCYWNSRVHGDSSVACGFVFLADRIKTGVICVSSGEKKEKKERKKKKNAISWLPWKRREEGRRILSRGLCIIYPSVFFEHRCKDFHPRVKIFQLNIWNIFLSIFFSFSLSLFFSKK